MKDLYNKEIVAYPISRRNDVELVLNTLKQVVEKEDVTGTMIHSDQRFQYTSHKYKNVLQAYSMTRSMSRRGNCLDNASMENFFGHLKAECLYLEKYETQDELVEAVHSYIHFYNHKRIQLALGNKSPVEYRTQIS